jgi:peptide-methionine (R)-S-oxide reductase
MLSVYRITAWIALSLFWVALSQSCHSKAQNPKEEKWRKVLTPEQFYVTREKGTERPFTGQYWNFFKKGDYVCVCCSTLLFHSTSKFESGCGWPSFSESAVKKNITYTTDRSLGMERTEITCTSCGAHLGHVFDDGPPPTGVRYCVNSASITFIPGK